MIILPSQLIKRKFPQNYKEGELDFCKPEFSYCTYDVELLHFDKAYVNFRGHLYDKAFKIVEKSLLDPAKFQKLSFFRHLKKMVLSRRKKLAAGEKYLLCFDEWSNNHYHWLCDFLPRLITMRKDLPDFTLLLPDTIYIRNTGITILEHFNLMPRRIEWIRHNKKVVANNVYLVTHPTLTGRINDGLIKEVKRAFNVVNEVNIKPWRRIYISREKAQSRKVLNEEAIIETLKAYNFEVINFETLTIEEQIKLAAETEILVSIHGAGLTNMMFMKPGAAVVEFRRDKIYHNQCYWHLADSLGLNYYYLFGIPDKETVIEGPHGCNLTVPTAKLDSIIRSITAMVNA